MTIKYALKRIRLRNMIMVAAGSSAGFLIGGGSTGLGHIYTILGFVYLGMSLALAHAGTAQWARELVYVAENERAKKDHMERALQMTLAENKALHEAIDKELMQ